MENGKARKARPRATTNWGVRRCSSDRARQRKEACVSGDQPDRPMIFFSSPFSISQPLAQARAEAAEGLLELVDGRLGPGAENEDPVGVRGQFMAKPAKRLAGQPLAAIAPDG